MPENNNKIKLTNLTVERIYDQILYVYPNDSDNMIDRMDIEEIYHAIINNFGHSKFIYITEFSSLTRVTPEARTAASEKEFNEHTIADAFVLKSFSHRVLGNLYLKLDKPPHPTRLFSEFEKALDWIKSEIIPKIDDSKET